jgi:hypothetical protein
MPEDYFMPEKITPQQAAIEVNRLKNEFKYEYESECPDEESGKTEEKKKKSFGEKFWADFKEAYKEQKNSPDARKKLLSSVGIIWAVFWTEWLIVAYIRNYFVLPSHELELYVVNLLFGLVATTLGVVAAWINGGQQIKTSLPFATTFLLLGLLWTAITLATAVVINRWTVTWFVGMVLTAVEVSFAMSRKLWRIDFKRGQYYLDYRSGKEPLRIIPPPTISADLRKHLLQAEIPENLLDKFLDYGGPSYMRPALREAMKPPSDPLLDLLFQQVEAPESTTKISEWVSAQDDLISYWNKNEKIEICLDLKQVITQIGTPIQIVLRFNCYFNPEKIREPQFRAGLKKLKPAQDLKLIIRRAAEKTTRERFVELPLDSALTVGSINRFRQELPDKLAWLEHHFGVTVDPYSVMCRPNVATYVEQQEITMIGARAKAYAETAKLRTLLEQVLEAGVPPKLLAGLLMLDQPIGTMFHAHDGNVIELPEGTADQEWRFSRHKYGFDPEPQFPPPAPPQLSSNIPPIDLEDTRFAPVSDYGGVTQPMRPAPEPPPPPPPAPQPPPEPFMPNPPEMQDIAPPQPPKRPSRRPININERVRSRHKKDDNVVQTRRGDDGVYRPEEDDDGS